jgi:hypothetical protein
MEGEGVLNWDRKRNAFNTTSNGFASGRSCDNKLSREKMLIKAEFPMKREIHQQARNQHTDPQEPQSQVSLVRLS